MAGQRPRHLVLKALATAVDAEAPAPTDIVDGVQVTEPGHMQLYNFMAPGLFAGQYTIKVSQHVALDGTEMDLDMRQGDKTATQNFHVLAPQFVVPENDFHSTYPPQGHADQPNIAPHIIFSDPHLPWERSVYDDESDTNDVTPWLALFPFDVNHPTSPELRLTDDQLTSVRAALGQPDLNPGPAFSFSSTVQKFVSLPKPSAAPAAAGGIRIWIPDYSRDDLYKPSMLTDTTPVELIFVQGELFKKLFCPRSDPATPDLGQFRYCAHVRNINTTGITGAGTNDTGLFSVLHSKRSGPVDVAQGAAPRSQAVHLVSLEYLDSLKKTASFEVQDGDLVCFVSLYRWTYLCQPPLTVNFIDTMRDIGIQIKWSQGVPLDDDEETDFNEHIKDTPPNAYLRCPPSVLSAVEKPTLALDDKDATKALGLRLIQRLKDGYSLVRYRVQSGEETVGLQRGPLLPVYPKAPPSTWPYSSTNGQDYQILDTMLGVMDISYSSAWQLGRLKASSDMGFVSALLRIRTRAYQSGVISSDYLSAHDTLDFKTQKQFFSSLGGTLDIMKQASAMGGAPAVSLRARWDRPSRLLDQSLDPHAFAAGVQSHVAIEGSSAGTDGLTPVQDLFAPTSTDWKFMHDWILDRMFLDGIPTHYLISDPKLLPPESFRLFHIDNAWMDCFIDGALSVANHSSLTDQDVVREEIKEQFNVYLRTPIMVDPLNPSSGQLHTPQVPTYGLFLRSAVVAAFQDLIVEVPFTDETTRAGKAPILVQKRLAPDLLMILLDRKPDSGAIPAIRFRQPPHQQRFCAADYLSAAEATYLFRKIAYTGTPSLAQFGPDVRFYPEDGDKSVFDWGSRCIDFANLQSLLFDPGFVTPKTPKGYPDLPKYFRDDPDWTNQPHRLTSSLVGTQLNDSMKYLEIIPPAQNNPSPPDTFGGGPYQLRTRPPPPERHQAIRRLTAAKASTPLPAPGLITPRLGPSEAIITPSQHLRGLLPHQPTITALAAIGIRDDETASSSSPPHTLLLPTSQRLAHTITTTTMPAVLTRLPIRTTATTSPQMTQSAFHYRLYPRECPFASSTDPSHPLARGFIYLDTRSLADLVVSILIDRAVVAPGTPAATAVALRTVVLSIPLGPSSGRPLHDTHANGGGGGGGGIPGFAPVNNAKGVVRARMLGNQRWAAVVDPSTAFLTVRLVARSGARCEGLGRGGCDELSFLLSGMDTGWLGGAEGKEVENGNDSVVIVREVYGLTPQEEQGSVGNSIRVRRRTGWKPFDDTVSA